MVKTTIICDRWEKNKEVNPMTGRAIRPGVKGGVYQKLKQQCERDPNSHNDQVRHKQQKYCRCVMKVRGAGNPKPYGICYNSVLLPNQIPRPKCEYDLSQFTYQQLKAYAYELQGRKHYPMKPLTAKAENGHYKDLVAELSAYIKDKKSKEKVKN